MTGKTIELFVPAITPFRADLSMDPGRLVDQCRWLLGQGAHGLAPFGTTSEANSLTIEERRAGLEALVAAGIAPDRIIPGTGCCAAEDTAQLSRHAAQLGCRGVLMLPPFYYKGVDEAGLHAAFARTIEACGPDVPAIYLYHIPQMSGVPITLGLIERLRASFGDRIAGLKDSSGDWDNTVAVIAAFPELDVYSASESMIPRNAAAGGAGCISASSNVNPGGIRQLIDGLGTKAEAVAHEQVSEVRRLFEGLPLIPAIKAAVAQRREDPDYARVRPPLAATTTEHAAAIAAAVRLSRSPVAA